MHRSPIVFTWSGEAMFPLASLTRRCDELFVVGERYRMEEVNERSQSSHAHEFAWLAEAWRNLPEQYAQEPWAQSPEHLRKYALIRTGFCHTDTFACGSHAEAMRWAPRLRSDDEYCIVSVEGMVVHRFRAMSQSKRAMGAKKFQESKQAILEFVSSLLGVSAANLQQQGEAA